jgi:hypothetical protein
MSGAALSCHGAAVADGLVSPRQSWLGAFGHGSEGTGLPTRPTVQAVRGRTPRPGAGDYQVSMQERFFPDLTGGGGLDRNVSTTRRRVVAGSMTSSISNTLATFSAFPCW